MTLIFLLYSGQFDLHLKGIHPTLTGWWVCESEMRRGKLRLKGLPRWT